MNSKEEPGDLLKRPVQSERPELPPTRETTKLRRAHRKIDDNSLFSARLGNPVLANQHILGGDYLLATIAAHIPEGCLAIVRRKDGYMATGYFYRDKGGNIRLEPRPRVDDGFTVSEDEVDVMGIVIRVERDIKLGGTR